MYIIDDINDIFLKVREIKLGSNKTIFVFDIHKTTLTKEGLVNIEVKKYILHLLKNKYNVIFLSYDGKSERILDNNRLLNKVVEYRNIPRIFIKKRNKQLVLQELCDNNTFDKRMKYKAILIDDNLNNINDVINLKNPYIITYYYTKYNKYNDGHKNLNSLGELFSVFKK